MAVQRGRPSRLRLMQRNLEQQTLAGNAGLGMVADDSGNTHLLKDRIAMPSQPQMCFLQPVQIAELQQPEPGGAVIVQAKKMPQAPEGAVRGGAIFPHHMHDQLQRKQQEQLLQQQQQQQMLQQQAALHHGGSSEGLHHHAVAQQLGACGGGGAAAQMVSALCPPQQQQQPGGQQQQHMVGGSGPGQAGLASARLLQSQPLLQHGAAMGHLTLTLTLALALTLTLTPTLTPTPTPTLTLTPTRRRPCQPAHGPSAADR